MLYLIGAIKRIIQWKDIIIIAEREIKESG
jgi:hypothetical protein